jgi:hypothetical protein
LTWAPGRRLERAGEQGADSGVVIDSFVLILEVPASTPSEEYDALRALKLRVRGLYSTKGRARGARLSMNLGNRRILDMSHFRAWRLLAGERSDAGVLA